MKSSSKIIATSVIAALVVVAAFAVTLAFAGAPLQAATTGTPGTGTPGAAGAVAQATDTPQPTPIPPHYVRVWNSMCVEGVPYTLLSVPTDVRFALVQMQASSGPVQPSASLTPQANGSTAGGTGTGTPQASTGSGTQQAGAGTGTPQASIGTGVPVTGSQNSLGVVPMENSCIALGTVSGVQLIMCTGPQASKYQLYVHGSQGTQTYMGTLWDCSLAKTPGAKGNSSLATGMPSGATNTPPVANTPTTPQPTSTP